MRKPTTFCRINRQHPLAGDLVGAWLFNRNYADSVTGQPGELTGTPAFTILNGDMSLDLTGADDYIDYNLPQFANKPFTVVAYVRTPANQSDAEHTLPVIVSQGDTGAGEWMFRISNSAYPGLYGDAGSMDTPLSGSTVSYSTDYWLQARLMDNDCQTRINNVFCNQDITVTMSNFSTTKPLRIGNADGASNRFWGGHIHEVYIFSRFLTIPEMQRLQDDSAYRYGLFDKPRDVNFAFTSIPDHSHFVPVKVPWTEQPPAGTEIDVARWPSIVAAWAFDKTGDLVDLSGNGYTAISGANSAGTFTPGAGASSAISPHGLGRKLDGADDCWEITSSLPSTSRMQKVSSMLFAGTLHDSGDSAQRFIDKSNGSFANQGWAFSWDPTNDWLEISRSGAAGGSNFLRVDTTAFFTGGKASVVFTSPPDGVTGKAQCYLNGEDTRARGTVPIDIDFAAFETTSTGVRIGTWNHTDAKEWAGFMNLLVLFDDELPPDVAKSFSENPWQIFKPREIMVPFNEDLPELATWEEELTDMPWKPPV